MLPAEAVGAVEVKVDVDVDVALVSLEWGPGLIAH